MTIRTRWSRLRDIVIGGAATAAMLLTAAVARRWYNRWGATDDELARPMPGDELVKDPKLGYTRAITVDAPPEKVWPWLSQYRSRPGRLLQLRRAREPDRLRHPQHRPTSCPNTSNSGPVTSSVRRAGHVPVLGRHGHRPAAPSGPARCRDAGRSRHPRDRRRRPRPWLRRIHMAMGARADRQREPAQADRSPTLHLQPRSVSCCGTSSSHSTSSWNAKCSTASRHAPNATTAGAPSG